MNQSASSARKSPSLFVTVAMIVLLVSLASIFLGVYEFINGDHAGLASPLMSSGMIVMALSTYMLYMARKRMIRLISMEMQPLSSTVQCQKCGLKNIREFKRGDYIFKETDEKCPKDNEKMVISAIYREVKEKEKAKEMGY